MSEKNEICDVTKIHSDIVNELIARMPDEEVLYDIAELFKVFADSTRVRILYVLIESELCVCDISALLNMSQSAISHQLRVLKQSRLVKYRRSGKTIYYSLCDDHIKTMLDMGMEHVSE